MCLDIKKKVVEHLTDLALYVVMAFWINNSAFTILKLVLKVIEFIKSRVNKSKVGNETEKAIANTNLEIRDI